MKSVVFLACAATVLASSARAADPLCWEAESCDSLQAPMELIVTSSNMPAGAKPEMAEVSGGRFLQIAEGKGNPPKVETGEVTYTLTVAEAGPYYLWCRVWWLGECSNSFSMSVDGAPPFVFGEDGTYNAWHWVQAPKNLKQLTLSAGKHTLRIRNREDGVALDQVVLSASKRFVPVGQQDVTPAPAAP
jgi:hypothetical protein